MLKKGEKSQIENKQEETTLEQWEKLKLLSFEDGSYGWREACVVIILLMEWKISSLFSLSQTGNK